MPMPQRAPYIHSYTHTYAGLRVQTSRSQNLLPPLHDLGAHLDEAGFGLALGEPRDGFDSFVDVFLCQGARLCEAGAAGDDFAGLVAAWISI